MYMWAYASLASVKSLVTVPNLLWWSVFTSSLSEDLGTNSISRMSEGLAEGK